MIIKSQSTTTIKSSLSGVSLLPSTGEWVYSTTPATFTSGFGETQDQNTQWDSGASGKTNMSRSMDELQAKIPSANWVNMVVSWMGNDLRLGECEIQPKGEHFTFLIPGGEGATIDLDDELGAWGVGANGVEERTVYDLTASSIFMNRVEDGSSKAKLSYNYSVTGATTVSISAKLRFYSSTNGTGLIDTSFLSNVTDSNGSPGPFSGTLTNSPTSVPSGTKSIAVEITRSTDGSFNDTAADRNLDVIVPEVEPELKPDTGSSSPYPWIINGQTRQDLDVSSIRYDSPTEYNPVFVQWMNGRNGANVTTQYDTTNDPNTSVGQPYVDPNANNFVSQSAGAVLFEYTGGTDQEAYSGWNHSDQSGDFPGQNIPYGNYRWRGYIWSPVERDFNFAIRKGGPGNDFIVDPFIRRIPAKEWVEVFLDLPADGTYSYVEFIMDKTDSPQEWFMVTNVTMFDLGEPNVAYGGTPADRSVLEGIEDMKNRGLKVLFYPFILMDISEQQGLPDPSGAGVQGAFPWRGRIRPMLSDQGTSQVETDLDAFFGTCGLGDFTPDFVNKTVEYSGPNEWGLRRMILHYAYLCSMAGNVDAFCIASEMVGVTTARSGDNTWPAVNKLKQLADDCRSILGDDVEITYACDWSEFMPKNYEVSSGFYSIFHLDPLWTSKNIDFIGIDNYLPLSDWRGTPLALDDAIWGNIYEINYLQSQIEGGERYDYEYRDRFDRDNQIRTPLIEWRFKDKAHKEWWSNPHFNIVAGVQQTAQTGWTPKSKRFVYTEYGCAAIDKGTNQPNKFRDPKSSEDAVPFYSNGNQDVKMQRAYHQAMTTYWQPEAGNNPQNESGEYFLDYEMMFAWTWDARPWPAFPRFLDVWSDGVNYSAGHWLQGRQWIEKT